MNAPGQRAGTRREFLHLGAASLAITGTAAVAVESPRLAEIKRELGLRGLEGESGWFKELHISAQASVIDGRSRQLSSSIYYLLDRERPVNFLHWLAPDDTHILCEGGPLEYFVFKADGTAERHVVGRNLAAGERPMVFVPGNSWKAIRLLPGAEFALLVNVLTPQWTPDAVKIGAGAEFLQRWRGQAPWATETLLKELIGPNWRG
jgi:predicted cupin superfamily sugar epimerase